MWHASDRHVLRVVHDVCEAVSGYEHAGDEGKGLEVIVVQGEDVRDTLFTRYVISML